MDPKQVNAELDKKIVQADENAIEDGITPFPVAAESVKVEQLTCIAAPDVINEAIKALSLLDEGVAQLGANRDSHVRLTQASAFLLQILEAFKKD